ncbi:phosphatidylinositol 4-kinase gamma 7-like [Mangifera indica]|uniref:phosphatidylinositol 4-kinase gamma 7-like n=1 Tax=Mangifera indica TaxID=29780 RepID=UPI001CF974A7|nr:phosphatidylinositol 4-kinase gamma 7-like [Mangifera indica]XP_044466191.1 phosphatidylinositol 4-kinase gamma 7-like [Mangifera indica]
MSRNFGSPMQTQMAVSVFNSPCNVEYHGDLRGKSAGTRRVFVQTDNGCVLGMELNRNDNARTVKRRLQLVLNVPTDESSLTFGDLVLNNDLSAVRNDSPLLLTRNALHRSSSTPCLSPTGNDQQQRDKSGPIEILGSSSSFHRTNELIKEIIKAVQNGFDPIPINSGLGGAYFFRNCNGDNVAIVKPTDEEPFAPNNPKGFVGKALGQPGLKPSVRVGETGFREVAAYLLDYNHFANVPPTVLVKVTHSIFNLNDAVTGNKLWKRKKVSKIASLQQFMPHDFDAGDYGTSSFPVAAIHRIGILDVRIFNTDRHSGNLLVRKHDCGGRFGQVELIPIDHGLCLPESLEDPYFEWIHWPQASIPFSEDELEYIKNLDPVCDSEMLRTELPMIREGCLRVLVVCTVFLKEAAAFGLCLSEIGEMMSREFSAEEEVPSELEVVCLEARRIITERELLFSDDDDGREEDCLFDLDCDDAEFENGDFPSKLESLEEDEFEVDEKPVEAKGISQWNWLQAAPKLSQPVNKVHIRERSPPRLPKENQPMCSLSESVRSANDRLSNTKNFVKLSDMKEEEWSVFLEKFKELLHPALTKRRCTTIGWRHRGRLGTSCKF